MVGRWAVETPGLLLPFLRAAGPKVLELFIQTHQWGLHSCTAAAFRIRFSRRNKQDNVSLEWAFGLRNCNQIFHYCVSLKTKIPLHWQSLLLHVYIIMHLRCSNIVVSVSNTNLNRVNFRDTLASNSLLQKNQVEWLSVLPLDQTA